MKVNAQDLELAKLKLKENDLNLVIVKNGTVIFETKEHGIKGFLQAIEKLDKNLVAASAADKIAGVAAAKLIVYAGLTSVFALTISEEGIKVLADNNISYGFEKNVPTVLNRDKSGVCPFEKMAMASRNSEEAYTKLNACMKEMSGSTKKNV